MNPQFLIAKLAANATESAWSQAYSTLNFYVAISVTIKEPGEKPVALVGKELLEKLQREYFSLDDKNIESIKTAVENTVSSVDESVSYDLVLVTNNEDTLFIVIAGGGTVFIKRNNKLGVVAKGQPEIVNSFSGPLHHNDIVLVQTEAFANKFPPTVLNKSLETDNISEISESIAPLLHEETTGGEAAVLLQFISPDSVPTDEQESETVEDNETKDNLIDSKETDKTADESISEILEDNDSSKKSLFSYLSLFFSSVLKIITLIRSVKNKRRLAIGLAIVGLIIFLVASIVISSQKQQTADSTQAINEAIQSAQTEFEEGEAIEPVNRPLALDKYIKAKDLLTQTKLNYPDEKNLTELNVLLSKIDSKLSQLSSGQRVENGEEIVKASDIGLDQIHTITVKGGILLATDKAKNLVSLSSSGTLDKSYELDTSNIIDITADSDSAYILTNSGVTRVTLRNGNETELFEIESARTAIDIFGSNIYLLNSASKMVEKYSPSAYSNSDYLNSQLQNTPVSMGIDGSVYVVTDNGKAQKFTRGEDDGYNITGTQGNISKNSIIYSSQDYTYVYVLDRTNQRVLITSKNGEVKQEYSWDIISKAVDFSADEAAKNIFIATPDGIYSFTF